MQIFGENDDFCHILDTIYSDKFEQKMQMCQSFCEKYKCV